MKILNMWDARQTHATLEHVTVDPSSASLHSGVQLSPSVEGEQRKQLLELIMEGMTSDALRKLKARVAEQVARENSAYLSLVHELSPAGADADVQVDIVQAATKSLVQTGAALDKMARIYEHRALVVDQMEGECLTRQLWLLSCGAGGSSFATYVRIL